MPSRVTDGIGILLCRCILASISDSKCSKGIPLVHLSLFVNHVIVTLPDVNMHIATLLFLALILGAKLVSNANNIKHATNDVSINGYD